MQVKVTMADGSALVLFSGGQDSTVCLAWALDRYARVETVGFAYGQRHAVELAQRRVVREALAAGYPEWAARLGADHMLDLATLGQISDTALTREARFEMTAAGLPNTFVPGRNLLFFTYAAALAYRSTGSCPAAVASTLGVASRPPGVNAMATSGRSEAVQILRSNRDMRLPARPRAAQ